MSNLSYDVVVAGGGNAGLCAAIAARLDGASVLLVERPSREWRGGNSKYTRNARVAHMTADSFMPDIYDPDSFLQELIDVTGPDLDRSLAQHVVEQSLSLPSWMEEQGVRWQAPLQGTLQLARTNRFFLGGGKALINKYYARAEQLGVDIRYSARVTDLSINDNRCTGVTFDLLGAESSVKARSVIVCTGGFEANREWLRHYWGSRVDNYVVRGCADNDGLVLRMLLEDFRAQQRGNPRGHHAVAVDARSPKFDGGIVTRIDSIPFSVVVNARGQRFADEGADLWPKRYAAWGELIGAQPDQVAYSIFDSKVHDQFIRGVYPPVSAPTIEELIQALDLPQEVTLSTLESFNASVSTGTYDPRRLDGCHTVGLQTPKSNWALPLDQPPYYCYPIIPGITFTYLAVGVDDTGRVLHESGRSFENLYAAGEIMAGNILLRGYLAGIGMTIGTVFGRAAGRAAAEYSRGN